MSGVGTRLHPAPPITQSGSSATVARPRSPEVLEVTLRHLRDTVLPGAATLEARVAHGGGARAAERAPLNEGGEAQARRAHRARRRRRSSAPPRPSQEAQGAERRGAAHQRAQAPAAARGCWGHGWRRRVARSQLRRLVARRRWRTCSQLRPGAAVVRATGEADYMYVGGHAASCYNPPSTTCSPLRLCL